MAAYILQAGSSVTCSHGGQAQPSTAYARVKVDGQPVTVQADSWTVSGCAFNISGSPVPCVTGLWTSAAKRVKAGGQPVLLQDSQATTVPNGVSLSILSTQTRVKAS